MNAILILEPYKMLQRAFAIVLPLEYKVCAFETLPDAVVLKDFDLAIVDAAALTEKGLLSASDARAVGTWKVPTVWIESNGGPAAPRREKLHSVTTPVQKDALLKAVADLLAAAAGAKLKADGNLEQRTAKEAKRPKPRSATKRTATEPNIIELVDVVEEVADHSETSALQD
jgi:hypothetical protein